MEFFGNKSGILNRVSQGDVKLSFEVETPQKCPRTEAVGGSNRVPTTCTPYSVPGASCGIIVGQNLNSNTPWLRSRRILSRSDQPFRNARFISKKFPFCPTVDWYKTITNETLEQFLCHFQALVEDDPSILDSGVIPLRRVIHRRNNPLGDHKLKWRFRKQRIQNTYLTLESEKQQVPFQPDDSATPRTLETIRSIVSTFSSSSHNLHIGNYLPTTTLDSNSLRIPLTLVATEEANTYYKASLKNLLQKIYSVLSKFFSRAGSMPSGPGDLKGSNELTAQTSFSLVATVGVTWRHRLEIPLVVNYILATMARLTGIGYENNLHPPPLWQIPTTKASLKNLLQKKYSVLSKFFSRAGNMPSGPGDLKGSNELTAQTSFSLVATTRNPIGRQLYLHPENAFPLAELGYQASISHECINFPCIYTMTIGYWVHENLFAAFDLALLNNFLTVDLESLSSFSVYHLGCSISPRNWQQTHKTVVANTTSNPINKIPKRWTPSQDNKSQQIPRQKRLWSENEQIHLLKRVVKVNVYKSSPSLFLNRRPLASPPSQDRTFFFSHIPSTHAPQSRGSQSLILHIHRKPMEVYAYLAYCYYVMSPLPEKMRKPNSLSDQERVTKLLKLLHSNAGYTAPIATSLSPLVCRDRLPFVLAQYTVLRVVGIHTLLLDRSISSSAVLVNYDSKELPYPWRFHQSPTYHELIARNWTDPPICDNPSMTVPLEGIYPGWLTSSPSYSRDGPDLILLLGDFDTTGLEAELKIWLRESQKTSWNNETLGRIMKILWSDPVESKAKNLLKMSKSEVSMIERIRIGLRGHLLKIGRADSETLEQFLCHFQALVEVRSKYLGSGVIPCISSDLMYNKRAVRIYVLGNPVECEGYVPQFTSHFSLRFCTLGHWKTIRSIVSTFSSSSHNLHIGNYLPTLPLDSNSLRIPLTASSHRRGKYLLPRHLLKISCKRYIARAGSMPSGPGDLKGSNELTAQTSFSLVATVGVTWRHRLEIPLVVNYILATMAVIDRNYPDGRISTNFWQSIHGRLIDEIAIFDGNSLEFLKSANGDINPAAELEMIQASELSLRSIVTVWIPPPNGSLPTDQWRHVNSMVCYQNMTEPKMLLLVQINLHYCEAASANLVTFLIDSQTDVTPYLSRLPRTSGDITIINSKAKGRRTLPLASVYMQYEATDSPGSEVCELTVYARRKSAILVMGCDANAHHCQWAARITKEDREALIELTLTTLLEDLVRDWKIATDCSFSDHSRILSPPFRDLRKTNWETFIDRVEYVLAQRVLCDLLPTDLDGGCERSNLNGRPKNLDFKGRLLGSCLIGPSLQVEKLTGTTIKCVLISIKLISKGQKGFHGPSTVNPYTISTSYQDSEGYYLRTQWS
ncbi:hypothetical protein CVS40_11870 [Lucilia cuprina]|nr:hypothetical protein CVS40_11870 [Lucilia cuprina]